MMRARLKQLAWQVRAMPSLLSESEPQGPILISCHIGKTGGTSIRAMLEAVHGTENVGFLTRPPGSGPISRDLYSSLPYLYGDKKSLDSHDLRYLDPDGFWPGARFMTVLRDPVETFFSGYFFVRYHVGMRLGDVSEDERKAWLEENYPPIEDMACIFENNMTRFLAWKSFYQPTTAEDLDIALTELPKYDVIALNERLGDSVTLLAGLYPEFAGASVPSTNVTPGRARNATWASTMEPNKVAWARDLLQYDLRLYDRACELFEERLKAGA